MKKHSFQLAAAVFFISMANLFALSFEYTDASLKRNLQISRAVKQKSAEALAVKTLGDNQSAFYQQNLDWKTSEIKQIIAAVRVDKPGQLRLSCNTVDNGKRLSINIFLPAAADGKFHDCIFDMAGQKNWQGVITNYELRWFGPEDTLLEIKKIAISDLNAVKIPGNILKQKVHLFNAEKIAAADELLAVTAGSYGGFHQQNLTWSAEKINTVSVLFKSNKPGTLRYACMVRSTDGKKTGNMALPLQKVPGDDQYHLYTFNLSNHAKFAGIQTNYELRFTGDKGAIIGLKEMITERKDSIKTPEEIISAQSYVLKTSSSAGADGIVKCGESVTLKVQALRNGQPITDPDLYLAVRHFSDGEGSKTFSAPIDKEFALTFVRNQPGRSYISCRIKSRKYPNLQIKIPNPYNSKHFLTEHGIGVWFDPHKQRIQRQEPADFDKFWAEKKSELAKVPLKVLEKVPVDSQNKGAFEVYDVKISCTGPAPVSGIVTIPNDKSRKYPAILQYHGAGIRSASAYIQPGAITFNVNAHGLPNGREESFYEAITNDKSRNPYMQSGEKKFECFKYMFLRAVRALEYVRSLPEWNGKDLIVTGGSQGGAQTIAAAALDKSVTLAVPGIPAMIGIAEFTILPNVESAWPNPYTKDFHNKKDCSKIAEKFDYLDGAFFMRRITCPIHIVIGLYDTIAAHVPVAFNDCPAREKTITCIPDMGHYNYNPVGRKAIKNIVENKTE